MSDMKNKIETKNTCQQVKYSNGFTLVEIMVSLVISSILMLGVIQVFSGSKRNSKVNEAVSRVQENARFAMESILTDLRKAGYVGCSPDNIKNYVDTSGGGDDDIFNLSTGTGGWEYTASSTKPGTTSSGSPYTIPSPFTVTSAVSNWDNSNSVDLHSSLANKVAPGSDVIIIKWAEPVPGVTGAKSNNEKNVTVGTTAPHGFEQGDVVLLSDCNGGDLFTNTSTADKQLTRGTAAGWEPGNVAGSGWSQDWEKQTQVMRVQSKAYYIGMGAGGGPALWRASYHNSVSDSGADTVIKEELVEGIENIQFLYGVDSDDDGIIDSYNTAENVSHAQVASLQMGMIVASDAESLSTAKSRTLNVIGTYIKTPNDRKLRYVFSSTTKLRNKGVK